MTASRRMSVSRNWRNSLALSVALMGVAANFVARLLKRMPWIAYVGLVVIAGIAFKMIWDGGLEVFHFADVVGVF